MKWYFSRKNLFKVANETLLFAIRCDIRCVCCSLQSPSSPTNITFTSHKRYKWIWSESQQTTAWSSLHQSYQSFIDNFWFPSNDFIRKARALSLYINTNATTYYHLLLLLLLIPPHLYPPVSSYWQKRSPNATSPWPPLPPKYRWHFYDAYCPTWLGPYLAEL